MDVRWTALQACLLTLYGCILAGEVRTACEQLCDNMNKPGCVQLCWDRMSAWMNMNEGQDGASDQSVVFPEQTKKMSSFVRIGREPIKRQKSAFVRIGRGPSSFVRIGRAGVEDKRMDTLLPISNEVPQEELMPYGEVVPLQEKRASSFVRIGKSDNMASDDKRASSFVRIGKDARGEPTVEDLIETPLMVDENGQKRASNFVRIGRPGQFVRIGRAYPKRISSFVRIGKRPSSFVRIGKKSALEPDDFEAYQLADESPINDKRTSSFVRIGKNANDDEEKRASSFVRIGKSPSGVDDKRASSFVRIGKASSFVRIGKSLPENEAEKRASNFVRIGKSLGWALDDGEANAAVGDSPQEKRASSFVRIGRSSNSPVEEQRDLTQESA